MVVGDRIRIRREELGITQEELASRMGYKSRSTIAKIEKNVNDVTQTTLVNFAKALNTSPAYLMGWIDEEKEKENAALAATVKRLKAESGISKIQSTVDFLTGKQVEDPEVVEFSEMFEKMNPKQRESVKKFMIFTINNE